MISANENLSNEVKGTDKYFHQEFIKNATCTTTPGNEFSNVKYEFVRRKSSN